MKKSIFWGVILICAALLIILDAIGTGIGFLTGVPVIRIILGVLCIAWVVNELYKKNVSHIFFPLAFIVMLFKGEIASLCGIHGSELMSNWLILLCALLFTIGVSIIMPHKGHCYTEVIDGTVKKTKEGFKEHKFMGSSTKYIDCSDFINETVDCNMGSCTVFFENTDKYEGNGTLFVDCNMSSVTINVPVKWRVIESINNSMGSVNCQRCPNEASDKILNIKGENNMGSVSIKYVN